MEEDPLAMVLVVLVVEQMLEVLVEMELQILEVAAVAHNFLSHQQLQDRVDQVSSSSLIKDHKEVLVEQ